MAFSVQYRYLFCVIAGSYAHSQGEINPDFVVGAPEALFELSAVDDEEIRYFDLVEPAYGERFTSSSSRLILAGRGGYGAMYPSDETWNIAMVESGPHNRANPESKIVIYDRGFSSNGFMRKFGSTYYAFGGEYIDDGEAEWEPNDPRDGIHGIRGDDLNAIRNGAWLHPVHGFGRDPGSRPDQVSKNQFVVDGWHEGRHDARGGADNVMMFDGKVSVTHKDDRWFVYARANLAYHGGRHVVLAKSKTSEPWGVDAYEPFKLISIEGYEDHGPGNVYFAGIDRHPLDPDMLVGLFPINLGEPGRHDGDGESFIGMALSCDGLHFSELTKLVWTNGREGRTWDHPVDGLLLQDDGSVSFMVHNNVKGISPLAPDNSRILKYQLKTEAFLALSRNVKQRLTGCQFALHPPPSPTPSFPKESPPPPHPSPQMRLRPTPSPPMSAPSLHRSPPAASPFVWVPSSALPSRMAPSAASPVEPRSASELKAGREMVAPVFLSSFAMLLFFAVYKYIRLQGRSRAGFMPRLSVDHSSLELIAKEEGRANRADRSSSRSEGNHGRIRGKASQSETARLQGSAAGSLGPQEEWEQLNETAERPAETRMEANRAQAAGAKKHSHNAALNMDMED